MPRVQIITKTYGTAAGAKHKRGDVIEVDAEEAELITKYGIGKRVEQEQQPPKQQKQPPKQQPEPTQGE